MISNPVQPDSQVGSWQDLARRGYGQPAPEDQSPALPVDSGHAAAAPAPEVEPASVHSTSITSDAVELTPISQTTAEDYRAFDELLAKSDAAYAETTNVQSSATGRWRIPLIAAAVLAVVAGLAWFSQGRHARPEASKPAIVAQKANPPSPVSAAESVPLPPSTTPQAALPLPHATTLPPVEAASKPAGHDVPLSQSVTPVDAQPPDPELAAGMRSLQGNGVPRDSAEAARHLWQSVKKQNGAALVVLAGLYAQGDGVAKDCDQARILLDAAAKQAKSHTQFQHVEIARETLRTSGCQ